MRELLVFTEEHVQEATVLYLKVMRGRKVTRAPQALEDYFREIYLKNPWVSTDIPALMCFENGAAIGFLGVVPRPMEFAGRPIRAAVTSQFVVDRERHRGPAGLELMGRFLKGPQDLSYCDGVGEGAHLIWLGMGAHAASSYSFNWLRPLRPLRTVENYADRLSRVPRLAGRALLAAMTPIESLLAKAPVAALRKPESPYVSKPVDADELFECIQEAGWPEPLKPAYDLASFRWLMSQAASARTIGQLYAATVHNPDGDRSGWYVYLSKRGAAASVLQIGARRRHDFDSVLSALFRDAWGRGASSVKGQAMPQYLVNLTNQYCLFRHPNTSVLFHSRNKDIVDTIYRGKAALSRLDGECWMRFAVEPWADAL